MNKQEGTLRVAGHNGIQIYLKEKPCEVKVEFLDEEIVPCNHHHHHDHHDHHHHPDKLVWRVAVRSVRRSFWHIQREYLLEIMWEVESIRTIKWVALY